jgi:hypothetical protein
MKCLDASLSLCGWRCSFLPDDAVFEITSGLPIQEILRDEFKREIPNTIPSMFCALHSQLSDAHLTPSQRHSPM